jgi:branched-chain amino acid aminotransferase
MKECTGNIFIYNQQRLPCKRFYEKYPLESGLSIYEVLRVEEGVPAFLDYHLSRLFNSLKLEKIKIDKDKNNLVKNIFEIIKENKLNRGRIKIILQFPDFPENYNFNELYYQTENTFPPEEYYKKGVKTILCNVIRDLPNVKIVNTAARNQANKKIKESGVYEAILMNPKGYLTEGSRSNLFFIKNNQLFTPHDDNVLQGIARKNVIEICREKKLDLVIKNIHYTELTEFEACFLTGTSPKILPVNQVNDLQYDVYNKLMRKLMEAYDKKLKKNLSVIKKNYSNII